MKHILAILLFAAILGAGCSNVQKQPNVPIGTVQTTQSGNPTQPEPASGKTLDLSGHGLTAIPTEVFSRTDLEHLDLSNNHLTGAPQSQIGQLKNLKSLNLSGNSLTGLPAELGQLGKLEMLNVSNNKLTGLPNELGNLTQLRIFDITGNPYSAQDLDDTASKLINTEIRR